MFVNWIVITLGAHDTRVYGPWTRVSCALHGYRAYGLLIRTMNWSGCSMLGLGHLISRAIWANGQQILTGETKGREREVLIVSCGLYSWDLTAAKVTFTLPQRNGT